MKIALIVGTRPEYIKVAPVYKEFNEDLSWFPILISTGQHDTMLSQLYDFFEIRPDYDLQVMHKNQSLESLTEILIKKVADLLLEIKPDFVLVQGDTTTTFIASLAAYYKKIPVVHLEAGLRTDNKFSPFPEEINRRFTSILADYHFCSTDLAKENLNKENIRQHVYVIGNTVIDSLQWTLGKIKKDTSPYEEKFAFIYKKFEKVILVTAHRREGFNGGLKEIAQSIKSLATKYENIGFVFPVHLNPNVKALIQQDLGEVKNVFLLPPQDYDNMVYLMSKAHLIMTDSGGIQEEAPTLNKLVLVMRNTTERQEAIDANFSILCGTRSVDIISNFNKVIIRDFNGTNKPNPYGDGQSAKKLKSILNDIVKSK